MEGVLAAVIADYPMPSRRGTPSAAARQADSLQRPPPAGLGTLSCLDANTLGEVLRVARKSRVLEPLATTSRRLCTLARSEVPLSLYFYGPSDAQLVQQSHAHGRPPFSGCEQLHLVADSAGECLMAVNVLGAAQHWPALQQMELEVHLSQPRLPPWHTVDLYVGPLLQAVLSLKQLRKLELKVPDLGPCSTAYLGHLVQITCLGLSPSPVDPEDAAATAAAAAAAVADVRRDLRPLSHLTNLRELTLRGAPAVKPAAGAEGPFCFPESLTALALDSTREPQAAWLACWITHLPGCPQLQRLAISYPTVEHLQQHASAHPAAVIWVLNQHTPRLRHLMTSFWAGHVQANWGAAVAGLPDAAGPVEVQWRPDAALAQLTGLECIHGGGQLTIKGPSDWQHLAQLTAVSELGCVHCYYVPPPLQAETLVVLRLENCYVHLSGRGLGRLLLSCPKLETVSVAITVPLAPAAGGSSEGQLQPHPTLRTLVVCGCHSWASEATAPRPAAAPAAAAAATAAPAAAAAEFGGLAPVVQGVWGLTLADWPTGSSCSPTQRAKDTLPDLSPRSALTALTFSSRMVDPHPAHPEQEQFLCMLRPLVTLRRLQLANAKRVNARVVLVLQYMLPRLQYMHLRGCASQLALVWGSCQQQQLSQQQEQDWEQEAELEQQALEQVLELVLPHLVLEISGW